MTFIDDDLPRAFRSLDDLHLLADLADASTEAVQRSAPTSTIWKPSSAEGQGHLPARPRDVRAEAAPGRRHHALRSIVCWRSPMRELQRDAGGIPARSPAG